MTTPPARPAPRRRLRVPLAAKKLLASLVIVWYLGARTYAVIRPSGARWYPFLSFPMFSRSYPPGVTHRGQELWARTCGGQPRAWKVEPPTLGYQDDHFLGELRAIAADRPGALRRRALLDSLAQSRLRPRPCTLQVWERTIPMTRAGVDESALRRPRRAMLREWTVGNPRAVRSLSAR